MPKTVSGSAAGEWRAHWPLVLATAMGMSLAALLSAIFGVMLAPIEQDMGWTRAEISSGPVVVSVMGLFLGTPAGHLIDRFGARRCGVLVVAITCAAIAAMSAVGDQLWHWWACWALFGVAGGFTSTVWLTPVSTIFSAGRGMAIAMTISGTGISMALAPAIAEWFVQNHGWRMGFLALAAIWLVMTLPLVLAFVPDRVASTTAEDADATAPGLTPREGFRARAFYLLFFASLVGMMTGIALVLNLVPILTFTGLSRTEAVGIVSSMGIFSIIGRFVGGLLMDRFEVRRLAIGACLLSTVLPLSLLAFGGQLWAGYAGVAAFGLTGGMIMNAIVYLTATHLGARSFGLFYGTISITATVAQGVGPLAANYVYDLTQSYAPTMWAAIPGYLCAALLFAALGPAPDFTKPG